MCDSISRGIYLAHSFIEYLILSYLNFGDFIERYWTVSYNYCSGI